MDIRGKNMRVIILHGSDASCIHGYAGIVLFVPPLCLYSGPSLGAFGWMVLFLDVLLVLGVFIWLLIPCTTTFDIIKRVPYIPRYSVCSLRAQAKLCKFALSRGDWWSLIPPVPFSIV
ncbi:hypothetical protein F4859DRAFT_436250 [Xylaria cf. heliscus]|nr:hypothetical protein F4859DRAFT_436250 [Xylaria cf. heliscus]